MIKRLAFLVPLLLPLAAQAQTTNGLIIAASSGQNVQKVLVVGPGQLAVGQGYLSDPVSHYVTGDCSLTGGGVITCLNTNGVPFGTLATLNSGTSGATVPLLNAPNIWSGIQSYTSGDLALLGASSGSLTINAAAVAGTNTLTLPAGTTDFSATGGTNKFVKQNAAGSALTVVTIACADLSNGATGCSTATGTSGATIPLNNGANVFSNALNTFTGHIAVSATPPVLSSCGTSPTVVGSDVAGTVTMGTDTPTGCVITFAAAYTSAPVCTVSWRATPLASQSYTVSTTAITLTQTATDSNKIDYHCLAQNGG